MNFLWSVLQDYIAKIKQEVDSLSSDGLTPEEQMDEVVLETKNLLKKQTRFLLN